MARKEAIVMMRLHSCNAYCRGDRHAEVFWYESNDLAEATRAPRDYCRSLGREFISAEAAPEARPRARSATTCDTEAGGIYHLNLVPGDRPWLMIWEGAEC